MMATILFAGSGSGDSSRARERRWRCCASGLRRSWPEHGDELFAKAARSRVRGWSAASLIGQAAIGIEVECDQFGEQFESADDLGLC